MPFKNQEKKREYDRKYQQQRRQEGSPSAKRYESRDPAKPFAYVTKEGRVIRGDVLNQYAFKSGEESQQLKADRFMGAYERAGLIQPLYNPETLSGITEVNTYHARACHIKARDAAGLGWDLVPKSDQAQEAKKEEIEEFLNGQDQPLTAILYRHQFDIEVIGHGGLEVVREGYRPDGRPVVLSHVPGHTLRIHQDEIKFAQKRGNKTRWFKRIGHDADINKNDGTEAEQGTLADENRASELLWNTLYSQRSDYYGVPDIIPALGAVHGDLARRDYNIAFFDNFGVPAYAVFITGDFDQGEINPETKKTELEETIEEHFKELAKNPHATLVLAVPTVEGAQGGDVKINFEPLAVDVKDASFRLYRKDNRDEVISAHGVPPYRLGIAEEGSLGGSTARESTEIYKASVINPRQEVLEGMINQFIIWPETGFDAPDWSFKFREIDTKDEEHDVDMVQKLFDMGAVTPREVIRIFGQRFGIEDDPADELLDQRFINGQPITDTTEEADQLMQMLKSVQNKIIRAAVKNERDTNDGRGRDRERITILEGGQKIDRMDQAGRTKADG